MVPGHKGSEELFTSSDAQPTVRVRWEITETKLVQAYVAASSAGSGCCPGGAPSAGCK